MIPSPAYINNQLRAIFKMAGNKPDWQNHLDMSAEGFFKSFWAIGLGLPFFLAGQYFNYQTIANAELPENFAASPWTLYSFQTLAVKDALVFLIAWAVDIFILLAMSKTLKAGPRVTPLIISYNWLSLFAFILFFLVGLISSFADNLQAFASSSLIVAVFVLYLRWGTIRRSLDTEIGVTLILMVVLVLLGFVVETLVGAVWFALFPPENATDVILTVIPSETGN